MEASVADQLTRERRSYTMSRIRKTNTKPEILVRKFLFSKGFRFRLHDKKLQGNPDIVLPKCKIIIFVNGCFWHAHEGCKLNRMPKTRTQYWIPKITRNVERDKLNCVQLIKSGWNVITIWECQLNKLNQIKTLDQLLITINNSKRNEKNI